MRDNKVVKGTENQEALEPRVLQFIREYRLISGNGCLLVAVSGGPDSICLLHILVSLREELNLELHIAHLNHQLRGVESEADALYVAQLAERLGVTATIAERDVRAYHAGQHQSLEEAAREVRYTFLAEVARSIGADRVAVGHTTDDNVETILMHLIRGSGTRGLRGLQPVTQWQHEADSLTIIRPLLGISRQETEAYCRRHKLAPRLDSSNLSLSPLRNRIRLELLPRLKDYNPQVANALLRTARIAGDDIAVIDTESARWWPRIARKEGDVINLDKKGFLQLPASLQRNLLRLAVESLLGSLKDIEARHIEGIMALLTRPAGKRLNLPQGLLFIIEYDCYRLCRDTAELYPFPVLEKELGLKIPGETLLPGWQVAASIVEPSVVGEKTGNLTAYLDFDKVGRQLAVRCRQSGDMFQPLGMSQPKSLAEFMIDAKIPRLWRQRIPIVASSRHILWVVGWRIDDRVKVTETTRQVLRLTFERLADNTPASCLELHRQNA